MEYTNTLIMEDVNTIIKQLLEINIIENKLINKDNLQIFKNKYQYLSNDMKKYIIEHALSKITDFSFKIQLLINIDFINMFTDNSQLISTIIIYIITHSYPHKKKSYEHVITNHTKHVYETFTINSCDEICYLINIILINKKVTLNQDDYKMFHNIIYKYLHTKCDDIYKLYDIITKYECEDKLEEL
jgi:hypothetical protein